MTKIVEKKVKCIKCGTESDQMIIYRINKKEKKDYKKIDLIEQKIRKQQS